MTRFVNYLEVSYLNKGIEGVTAELSLEDGNMKIAVANTGDGEKFQRVKDDYISKNLRTIEEQFGKVVKTSSGYAFSFNFEKII